jgi:hypothetical protein
LILLVRQAAPAAGAAEYRDPGGRFTIAVPEGFQEVDRKVLEARLAALSRAGVPAPSYQAAFDRGVEPRLAYPYVLLEVTQVPDAQWTAADLEDALGQMKTQQGAQDAGATLDRLGLSKLLRDPRLTFLAWDPDRQSALYRIKAKTGDTELEGTGRLYFYRKGFVTLWFYYLSGTPYADVADQFTAALTVLPDHRVPPGGWITQRGRRVLVWIMLSAGAMAGVLLIVLLGARRRRGRRARALLVILLAAILAGCAAGAGGGSANRITQIPPPPLFPTGAQVNTPLP